MLHCEGLIRTPFLLEFNVIEALFSFRRCRKYLNRDWLYSSNQNDQKKKKKIIEDEDCMRLLSIVL